LGAWISPAEALSRWELGTALLHPPALHVLRALAGGGTEEEIAARLRDPPHRPSFMPTRLEFQRGVRVLPLETPTLPPATHTNAYVLGNGELLIVDPGAAEVRQYAKLLALVTGLVGEGRQPKAVVLTHHHADHVGGARAVADRLKIPVWCHAWTADRLPFPADRLLADGDELVLQGAPAMRFRVLHTPGHARGHLCLVDESTRAAVVGDMVAGLGTILIDPPEGDMIEYLNQLRRLKDLPVGVLYPAHGPPLPDGARSLAEYLLHRERRERQVLEAVHPGGVTLRQVVQSAYAELLPDGLPVAERSTEAILIKLTREGRVRRDGELYSLA